MEPDVVGILSAEPDMTDEEFVEAGGKACPSCRSGALQFTNGLNLAGGFSEDVECLRCGLRFRRLFLLAGWEPIEQP